MVFLHELLHSPKFKDHEAIAEAIADIEGIGREWEEFGKSKEKFMDENSNGLINSWLQKNCIQAGKVKFMPWDKILETIGAKK